MFGLWRNRGRSIGGTFMNRRRRIRRRRLMRSYSRPRPLTPPQDGDLFKGMSFDEYEETVTLVVPPSDDEEDDITEQEPENLKVTKVDLDIKKNGVVHHTDRYDVMDTDRLVVRRGQPFDIGIVFNKPFDQKKDDIRLVFTTGDRPLPSNGTRVSLFVADKDVPNEWGAKIGSQNGNQFQMTIFTPPDCAVAKWNLDIDLVRIDENGKKTIVKDETKSRTIYIICNPWLKEDQVYMKEADWRAEYVMNETGFIYYGSKRSQHPRNWIFGQFQNNILDCALYLLDKSSLAWKSRGDVVKIVRKLSAMGNCQDDDGVLIGNWSGDYSDGRSPTSWNGSVKILEEYYKTKEPVAYGQCWVFSGLLTTLCRTLGIPTRSVTNFGSAHDTDGSVTIDHYIDKNGESLEDMKTDSIWNFHVWNEAWMSRPDLSKDKNYGGWQAIDATPQETSDGLYQCGPMPLAAIKCGDIGEGYDGGFIFGEVNADRVFWQVDGDDVKVVSIQSAVVGNKISTKAIKRPGVWGSWREDVTHLYKHPEGSSEERAAVMKANLRSTKKDIYKMTEDKILKFELIEKEEVPYGKDFKVVLQITNTGTETRTVGGCLTVKSTYYTGVPYRKIKTQRYRNEVVKASQCRQFEMVVTFDEYFDKLAEHCHVQMSCAFHVKESNHTFVEEDEFNLVKPELTIKGPKEASVGKPFIVDISFENPIQSSLSNCYLTLEGPGIQSERVIKQAMVQAKQTFMTSAEITPAKKGSKELVATFNSTELLGVTGSLDVVVK